MDALLDDDALGLKTRVGGSEPWPNDLDSAEASSSPEISSEISFGFFENASDHIVQLQPVAELDGAGNVVSRFVYATRVNVPDYIVKPTTGAVWRVVTDHLGSVRLVVDDASGAVVQRIDYDEFGRVLTDTNPGAQPFGFAGGLWDAQVGLVRFGARDYDPLAGRWTTKDPTGLSAGTNVYEYAFSDPVSFVDPDGEIPILANLIGAATGVATGYALAWLTGDCYGWEDAALDAAAGAIGAGIASKLNKLKRIAKLRSGRKGYAETWNTAGSIERLVIKHEAGKSPGLAAGSKVPRFEYRTSPGQFWDPFTGQTGPKGTLSHVPLEPPIGVGTAAGAGALGGGAAQSSGVLCGCDE